MLPVIIAAALSVGSGYAIDRYVFKSPNYTRGEMATDVGMGLFGGGLVRPVVRMGLKSKRVVQSHRYLTKHSKSLYGFGSRRYLENQVFSGYLSVRHVTRGNLKPLGKGISAVFAGRGIDHVLESRARSRRSPNRTDDPGTPKTPFKRGGNSTNRKKSPPKGGCPPGKYWSWKHNACMPSKF